MRHKALQAIGALWVLQAAPPLPAPRGYVNDFAGVIDAASQARIARTIDEVRTKSGGEIVVITMPSVGNRDVNDVALQFGREWQVGKKAAPGDPARNTGIIILVVPKETSPDGRGHVAIQTGSGTEGFLTDGDAGQIRDEAIPLFRARDYAGAIELLTSRVADRYAREFHFTLDSASAPPPAAPRAARTRALPRIPLDLLSVGIFLLILVLRGLFGMRRGCGGCLMPLVMGSGMNRGSSWSGTGFGGFSGGGGGGGFGGFGGGGGFSGGGASGSW